MFLFYMNSVLVSVHRCKVEVHIFITENNLKIYASCFWFLWLNCIALTVMMSEPFRCLKPFAKSSLRNLGMTFGLILTLDAHIKSLVHSCFYQIGLIAKSRSTVSISEL